MDEDVNLDDVSDNDSESSSDSTASNSQVISKKRKTTSSSEGPCTDDSRKTKKKKISHSNDCEIIDGRTNEQESVDSNVRGMFYDGCFIAYSKVRFVFIFRSFMLN